MTKVRKLGNGTVDPMEITALRQQLQYGDYVRIAKSTGYTRDYVYRVLSGRKPFNSKIIKASKGLIKKYADLNREMA